MKTKAKKNPSGPQRQTKKTPPAPAAKPEKVQTPASPKQSPVTRAFQMIFLVLLLGSTVVMWRLNGGDDYSLFQKGEPAAPEISKESFAAQTEELQALKAKLADSDRQVQGLRKELADKDIEMQRESARKELRFLRHYANLIRSRIELGQDFGWEMQQTQTLEGDLPQEVKSLLNALKPYAEGVQSRAALKTEISKVSSDIARLWKSKKAGSGFAARLEKFMRELVQVRKIGLIEGSTPEAIAARAEYYARQEKFGRAVTELQTLHSPYLDVATGWIDRAVAARDAYQLAVTLEHALKSDTMPMPAEAKVLPNPVEIMPESAEPSTGDLLAPKPVPANIDRP